MPDTTRYQQMEDRRYLLCRDCSTRTTIITIPANEMRDHDQWHTARRYTPWSDLGLVYCEDCSIPGALVLLEPRHIAEHERETHGGAIEPITLTLPGIADNVIRDGGWRKDDPAHWAQYEQGQSVRRGAGWQYTVTLSAPVAASLRSYLESVAGALASMTAAERGTDGTTELRALRAALDRWPS